ncbi:MAG: hypothetical protein NTV25_03330 [Methanothrix sp.]|nr:hypothetical protein [Methanothrix sp.]
MGTKVTIYDIAERAIIESFDILGAETLRRKDIIDKAHELTDESKENLGKRILKLKKMNYLIRHKRNVMTEIKGKKLAVYSANPWGVYSVNPEYEFIFECEPLPSDTTSIEIPLEQREAHTLDLKAAIENWISNFPNPPHLENTYQENTYRAFSASVKKCEEHSLFDDLRNHLSASDFEVFDEWENYKDEVKDLERLEKRILDTLELNISQIFDKLPIRFVKNYDSLQEDYQCSIPQLVFDHILEDLTLNLIYAYEMRKAQTDEEAQEIYNKMSYPPPIDFFAGSPLIESGDSIIWGYLESLIPHYQLLRIPKREKDTLMQNKGRANAFITNPPTEINDGIREIADKLKQLDQERENILKELKSSLYCQCFSGDCRYLGGKSS